MYNRGHGNDFTYIRERLNDIFLHMSDEPFTRLYQGGAMQRNLSDIQWMLNHNYYPAPGHVSFIISVLRDEKFRVVKENGCQAMLEADIQFMIDTLKDIRKYLLLVTRYEREGDIIRVESGAGWVNAGVYLCLAAICILCMAQFLIFSGYSPSGIYLCGVVLFLTTSLMLESKTLMFSLAGLMVFTLCSFFAWAG